MLHFDGALSYTCTGCPHHAISSFASRAGSMRVKHNACSAKLMRLEEHSTGSTESVNLVMHLQMDRVSRFG
jgi:hypothetical protein